MNDDHLVLGCYPCDQQAEAELAPREAITRSEHWRVAHAFNSTLAGWLVLLPTRHVTSFTDLPQSAAVELGDLIVRCSAALQAVTGCAKTYLMQFSEAEGFSHLHVHLVPRMQDQPDGLRGPRIFGYLTDDQKRWIPAKDRDDLAVAIRAALG